MLEWITSDVAGGTLLKEQDWVAAVVIRVSREVGGRVREALHVDLKRSCHDVMAVIRVDPCVCYLCACGGTGVNQSLAQHMLSEMLLGQ